MTGQPRAGAPRRDEPGKSIPNRGTPSQQTPSQHTSRRDQDGSGRKDMAALVAVSKRLSYALRHGSESIGIVLDPGGWTNIDMMLEALAAHGHPLTRNELDRVVTGTDKQRFEVTGDRIRAAQGHSRPIDLGLAPVVPPAVLYHGTVARHLPGILAVGLHRGSRHHVHLSPDEPTARAVGARRGQPVILRVDAAGMHRAGQLFYRAANGVWLTDHVPPQWITASEPAPPTRHRRKPRR